MVRVIVACIILLSMGSCIRLGVNFSHKTPKKASKYPKFTETDSLLGYNNSQRSCFDVSHYDIHLNIDPEQRQIAGWVTTSFSLTEKATSIQLDLYDDFAIDSVHDGTHKLTFKRRMTAVMIDLVSTDIRQAVSVYYHGKPRTAILPPWQGGFAWKKDENKKHFFGVSCEADGAQLWLPVKAWLGDEPDSSDMHFTVPKELTAVSNGNLISTIDGNNTRTFHWKTRYNINPYNITVYGGDYQLIPSPYQCENGTTMMRSYYVLPKNAVKAEQHFKQTDSILRIYEQLFGPYPWPDEGYKLVESPYAGMEHQTAIAYGNGYKNEKKENYDYIILHETAHEWWGNSVSVSDFSDLWIHEGFATYAEALYVEKTKGYQAYLDYMDYLQIGVVNKKPVVGPSGVFYSDYKDGDIYSKGASILHTLRNELNDDNLFFTIIKTFYTEHTRGITNTEDFISTVNRLSGRNLNDFFDQFLRNRESPYLVWNFDYDFDLHRDQIIYQFKRVDKDFTMGIEVEQGRHKFYIYPTTKIQFYTLPESRMEEGVLMNSKRSYLQDGYKKLPTVKMK